MNEHLKDGGVKSRKLWYSVGTSVLIFGAGLIAARWTAFQPSLATIVGGLLGALSLFIGGNVAGKHVLGKVAPTQPSQPTDPTKEG
jgi:membrane protein DedA with SNARE-associated domain